MISEKHNLDSHILKT